MDKRVLIATITGGLLGIFCIIGISLRMGYLGNELFIFATWINRVVMGFVIGLAGRFMFKKKSNLVCLRGAILGLIISGSFYIATSFKDLPGFFAGIVYGIIIDYIATKYE
jgi:hypothetical protein